MFASTGERQAAVNENAKQFSFPLMYNIRQVTHTHTHMNMYLYLYLCLYALVSAVK